MPNEEHRASTASEAHRSTQPRAEAPRPPLPTRAMQRALDEDKAYRQDREAQQLRSLMRGLIVLALVVMLASMARAGLARVFVPGWWRQW
jgi:hypothetical protein